MLAERVRLARKEVKAAQNLILQAELKARRRVLRRLGYVDNDGVVTVKGRAAAEIQSADELVLTELMFSGVFKVKTHCKVSSYVLTTVRRQLPSQACMCSFFEQPRMQRLDDCKSAALAYPATCL